MSWQWQVYNTAASFIGGWVIAMNLGFFSACAVEYGRRVNVLQQLTDALTVDFT